MNFFRSVFSEDLQPSSDPQVDTLLHSPPQHPTHESFTSEEVSPTPMPSITGIVNAWSFGGLIKTLATKSESVIETYRRDLEEFGTGLRKETAVIRQVAGRAVRDLPASLEAGAAVAQESLESVGQAIDVLGNTVTEIISHGKDSILAGDSDAESSDFKQYTGGSQQSPNLNSKPYSRLDAQIRSIQCDLKTYCEEPDDSDEFNEWKLGFLLEENSGEIENLIEENGVIDEIHKEIVPIKVDDETFWSRYFFRAYKLRKAEETRAELVKRAISGGEEEEDLSWDVEEDDYVENEVSKPKGVVAELKEAVYGEEMEMHPPDVKSGSEGGKTENGESCKDSDLSVVSTQPSLNDEEDLSWDEIEDSDETTKAATTSESPNKAEIRKRLSGMEEEEEEDLSWDIEDDDEPLLVKS